MKVMVGGTFDPLHDGHKVLLSRSFEIAGTRGHVVIGLTTDSFASRKTHPIRPFEVRKSELEQYITSRNFLTPFVVEHTDPQLRPRRGALYLFIRVCIHTDCSESGVCNDGGSSTGNILVFFSRTVRSSVFGKIHCTEYDPR